MVGLLARSAETVQAMTVGVLAALILCSTFCICPASLASGSSIDADPTCTVYGWVNDSVALTGIPNAMLAMYNVEDFDVNYTYTNETGFYSVETEQGLTMAVFAPEGYYSSMAQFDTTGVEEYRLDQSLEPEPTVPTISMGISPENSVSLNKPLEAHVTSEDFNLAIVEVILGPVVEREGDWVNFSLFDAGVAVIGWGGVDDEFPFTYIDGAFDGVYTWHSTAEHAGYLINETCSEYVQPRYIRSINGSESYGVPARYWNDTLVEEPGFAFFDNDTGEYLGFEFMNTTNFQESDLPPAAADDPYGIMAPTDFLLSGTIVHNDYGDTFALIDNLYFERVLEQRSISGLTFEYTTVVPDGDYAALALVADEANNMNMTIGFFTVDNEPPVADAGEDQYVMAGDEVTLTGTASEDNFGIEKYIWTFEESGHAVTLFGESVSYVFMEGGDHTVTLTVRDYGGNEDSDTMVVTVEGNDIPVADAGPSERTVPEDTPTTFDGSDSYDDDLITDYHWEINELDVDEEGVEFTYTFETPGTYHVVLTVTDSIGQESEPDTVVVTVTDETAPTADAGEDVYVQTGETVVLMGIGSSDNVGIVNYTWSCEDDGGWEVFGQVVERVFEDEGIYNVTLEVRDAAGHTDTDYIEVHVSLANEAPSADAGDDIEAEPGDTVLLDGSQSSDDAGIVNYTWTFEYDGETVRLHGESADFVFEITGTYTVNLTVTDEQGLTDYDEVVVTIEAKSRIQEYALLVGIVVAVAIVAAALILISRRRSTG